MAPDERHGDFKMVLEPHVVPVQESHPVPGGGGDACVAGAAFAAVRFVDDADARVLCRKPVQRGRRSVGRPVIHADHLEPGVHAARGRHHRVEARPHVSLEVVEGNDHRKLHPLVLLRRQRRLLMDSIWRRRRFFHLPRMCTRRSTDLASFLFPRTTSYRGGS